MPEVLPGFRSKHAVRRNRGGRWRDRWMGWASCRTHEGITDAQTTRRTFLKAQARKEAKRLEQEMIEAYGPLAGT